MTDQEILDHIKIKYNEFPKTLELKHNIIDEQIPILIKFLDEHPDITSLILDAQLLRKDGIEKLAENRTLKEIKLRFPHYISTNAVKALAANNKLEKLDVCAHPIGGMKIELEGLKALANNTTLKYLEICNGQIDSEGAKILATNKTLEELSLIGNNIGIEGKEILSKLTNLRELHIFEKEIIE